MAGELLEPRVLPAITFTVAFDDPEASQSAYYSDLEQNLLAAGAAWGQYLAGTATIDVIFSFSDSVPRATGGSETIVFQRDEDGISLYQEGAASEIKTGIDPNGASPDLRITIGKNYLRNELWFDTTPFSNSDPVPDNRTDGVSVLAHELGHGFGFIGYGNSENGSLGGNVATLFDHWVTFEENNLYFNGPQAIAIYGGPVPLTFGNHFHLGNRLPRPGSDLLADLMNGVSFFRGRRYYPSAIDLAILSDTNVPLLTEVSANHAPVILPQSFEIPEHSANGTLVGKVSAQDIDAGQTLSFAILSGNNLGAYQINPLDGSITVTNDSLLEFDTQSASVLTIQVSDNGQPNLSNSTTVTIQLTEVVTPEVKTSPGSTVRGKGSLVVIDPVAQLLSHSNETDVFGSRLKVTLTSGRQSKDRLTIDKSGDKNSRLQLKNGSVKRGSLFIATATGGSSGNSLELTFLSTATPADVEFVLRRIALQSSRKATGTRTIAFQYFLDNLASSPATKEVVVP